MNCLNIAVYCTTPEEVIDVQIIAEGQYGGITRTTQDELQEKPIVYTNGAALVFNWGDQNPTQSVMSYNDFIAEFGHRMHEIEANQIMLKDLAKNTK